ncbi:MAG: peptidoglycan DD-metalloendopeptidase family protein [Oscillospiraceae bacterium]|nr:peptidoglycan DD-metalloendopeptidase family protein [Oscillospiraceae bacterium]
MDMERFCDERVLKILGSEKASAYANTILDFAERESLSLSFFSAASLCERVTSIMKNKNKKSRIPAALMIFLAVALLMTACGTTPAPEKKEPISAGNLSAANSEAENLDKLLQEMIEVKLHDESENLADINPDAVTAEIPGLAEELQGFYGENAPNNYATDTYSLMQVEKIEKITVTGFYFAEGASASILLVPSNETKVSITYGDVLRENGLFVETNGNEITVSVGTPCEDIREAFDLRIYGDFEGAEIAIDNLPYEVYEPAPPAEQPEKPEITEIEDIGFDFVSPVEKGWIAVTFGGYKGHTGTDVSAESGIGTDILAVADGEVVKVKRDNTGYGYHIIINHGNGVQTCYAHCSELLVELGQEVEAGEVVAKMGATGNSTGIHLHFELLINGEYVDPEKYIIF